MGLLRQLVGSPVEFEELVEEAESGSFSSPRLMKRNEEKAESAFERYNVPISQVGLLTIEKHLINAYNGNSVVNDDHIANFQDNGIDIYEEMLEDDTVFSTNDLILSQAASMGIQLLPGKDKDQASRDLASFVEKVLSSFTFTDAYKEIGYARALGFSFSEIVYSKEPLDFKGRNCLTISKVDRVQSGKVTMSITGEPRYKADINILEGIKLPSWKTVFMRCGSGLYGKPLLKPCFTAWWYKKHGLKILMKYLERWGDPAVFGWHKDEETRKQVLAALKSVRASSYGSLPENIKEPFVLEPSTGFNHIPALQFFNDAIARVMLTGARVASSSDASGSFAATKEHGDLVDIRASELADSMVPVINEQLIKPVCDLNFGASYCKVVGYPYIKRGSVTQEDPNSYVDRVSVFFEKGIPIPLSRKEIYEKGRVAMPESEADTITPGTDSPPTVNFQRGSLETSTAQRSPKTRKNEPENFLTGLTPEQKQGYVNPLRLLNEML